MLSIFCFVVLVWMWTRRRSAFVTCEDNYQNSRKVHNHTQSDIIATIEYEYEPVSKYELQRKLIQVDRQLAAISSPESHPDPENMFTDVGQFRECREYNTKGYLDYPNKKFVYFINHEWIGGSKLAHSFQVVNKSRQKLLFYKTRWWYVLPALKLWWNREKIPKVGAHQALPLCTQEEDVRRLVKTYTMDKCQSLKATILYSVLKDVHTALHLQRPLVCYLPIAFYPSPTVNNNIGLMWLTFDPAVDTVATLAEALKANVYQVLGTNFLLYYNLVGGRGNGQVGTATRKAVDAVVTMIFSEDEENIIKSWTYKNVPEYPVYVAVSPILDNKRKKVYITQTLTVSTPAFDESLVGDYTPRSREYYMLD